MHVTHRQDPRRQIHRRRRILPTIERGERRRRSDKGDLRAGRGGVVLTIGETGDNRRAPAQILQPGHQSGVVLNRGDGFGAGQSQIGGPREGHHIGGVDHADGDFRTPRVDDAVDHLARW